MPAEPTFDHLRENGRFMLMQAFPTKPTFPHIVLGATPTATQVNATYQKTERYSSGMHLNTAEHPPDRLADSLALLVTNYEESHQGGGPALDGQRVVTIYVRDPALLEVGRAFMDKYGRREAFRYFI